MNLVGVRFLGELGPDLVDPWEVSKMVKKALSKVQSVKITRAGLVLILCVYADQKDNFLGLKIELMIMLCHVLTYGAGWVPVKGVSSGVSENVDINMLKKIPGVVDIRRMNRLVNGRKENSASAMQYCKANAAFHWKCTSGVPKCCRCEQGVKRQAHRTNVLDVK